MVNSHQRAGARGRHDIDISFVCPLRFIRPDSNPGHAMSILKQARVPRRPSFKLNGSRLHLD